MICLLILEREEGEGGRKGGRNIDVNEKHQLVASPMCPNQGLNLQLRYVPWPGIEPKTFWCMGQCSNQLSHPARAILGILYKANPLKAVQIKWGLIGRTLGNLRSFNIRNSLWATWGLGSYQEDFSLLCDCSFWLIYEFAPFFSVQIEILGNFPGHSSSMTSDYIKHPLPC